MDINGYLNLVPDDNYAKPKFMAFMESILSPLIDCQNVADLSDHFDINTAAGSQLDVIGGMFGVNRKMNYIPASGNSDMTDDEMRAVIKIRISQMIWDGGNDDATKIYSDIMNGIAEFSYYQDSTMHVDITIRGVENIRIGSALNDNDGYLVPAGVGKEVSIVDDSVTTNLAIFTGVTGESISGTILAETPQADYTVEDIEDMYVEDVESNYVNTLEDGEA